MKKIVFARFANRHFHFVDGLLSVVKYRLNGAFSAIRTSLKWQPNKEKLRVGIGVKYNNVIC